MMPCELAVLKLFLGWVRVLVNVRSVLTDRSDERNDGNTPRPDSDADSNGTSQFLPPAISRDRPRLANVA
jgi:hypothetical protein